MRRVPVLRATCPNHGAQAFQRDDQRCWFICPAGDTVITDEAVARNPDGGTPEPRL